MKEKGEKGNGIDVNLTVRRAGGYKKGTNGTDGTVAENDNDNDRSHRQYCGLGGAGVTES